jgi:large subunit ribosomal protein L21|tara:strand:- start:703 stop:1038 length:336 start_codon:yes stop_codon:yes gene_type:complete
VKVIYVNSFAIVETGGKQYRVHEGDTIRVESIVGDEGDTIDLESVKLISLDGETSVGTPNVEGAKVQAEVVNKGKGKKIVVFKYKAKTRYRRKNGHRQNFTDLRITDISVS